MMDCKIKYNVMFRVFSANRSRVVFQVTVIEEAIKYIDELHDALADRLSLQKSECHSVCFCAWVEYSFCNYTKTRVCRANIGVGYCQIFPSLGLIKSPTLHIYQAPDGRIQRWKGPL